MSEGMETTGSAPGALDRVTRVLVAQAVVLDEMFYRAAKEAYSTEDISYYHARKALKAQARCRATFNVLLKLRAAASARRAEARLPREGGKKFPNLNEGTIQTLKTPYSANTLAKTLSPPAAPNPARSPKRRPRRACIRWSPERRARQALAIRSWQPWLKSTGPRTEGGKARSARNALKHGLRSRATIEARREDRRLLELSTHNIATAKALFRPFLPGVARRAEPGRPFLPGVARRAEPGHSIDIGSATPALIPSRPRITRESRPGGTLPPVQTAGPRRGWRIAS
jgi:hypothetical protein